MGVLRRIDENDTVLVEQAAVALDHDLQIAAILEIDPGGAIREHIGVHRAGCVQRRAHPLADLAIPWPLGLFDLDAGHLPQVELSRMGAGLVAARDERGSLGLNGLQRGGDILRALDPGRVGFRPDQHEVVVHHRLALDAEAVLDELHLLRAGMHEHHVRVAAAACVERLSRALADDADLDTGLCLEGREQVVEQARIRGRCC